MSLLNALGNKLFNTEVLEEIPSASRRDNGAPKDAKVKRRPIEPVLVVMSRETERELYREDVHGAIYRHSRWKGEPNRVHGIRIANDDSLSLGEFQIAEKLY
jgi:hypothetical protein